MRGARHSRSEGFFLALLAFVPLALYADWAGTRPWVVFAASLVAIVPLAHYISLATEELASRSGPAVGGLLNATFGNAPELIISGFALSAGLVSVVKAAIIGSILGNLLLVLGTAILTGGISRSVQRFNATAARANASVLLLAATALVVPAVFFATAPAVSGRTVEYLSLVVAGLMLVGYAGVLLFSLRTHKHLYVENGEESGRGWSAGKSGLVLLIATAATAVVSEVFVGSIRPIVASFGWTEAFIGAVVIAIAGNAAEHASAVVAAFKDRMDLALQISIGSATQILMLVTPLLVIAGALLGSPMTLVFSTFSLVALIFGIFIANSIIEDGESNWFEGLQLVVVYAIVAVAFFFHP
jgi:Ca2+:H+ antiporter